MLFFCEFPINAFSRHNWKLPKCVSAELFFEAGDGKLTAVTVNTQGDMFTAGSAAASVDMRLAQTENGAQYEYDVSADGNRFLITTRGAATKAPLLSVIVN